MIDNRIEALAYVDKSIDNVADMPPEMIWENREVIQMLEDIRSLLVTGQVMPAEFMPHGPTGQEHDMSLTFDEQIEAVDRADWRSSYAKEAYPGITSVIPDSRWLRALHAEGFEIVRSPESTERES